MTKPDLTEMGLPDLTHLSQKNGGKFPFDYGGRPRHERSSQALRNALLERVSEAAIVRCLETLQKK